MSFWTKKIEKTLTPNLLLQKQTSKTFAGANGKDKVAHEPRRPTRPELIPLSAA